MTFTTILAAAAATLALGTAATQFLPGAVHVERAAIVDASPADVIALAASTEGYQRFNPFRSADPGLKITAFGPAAGVGSGFAFQGAQGKGTQTVTAIGPDSVTWTVDLGALGTSTQRMTVTPDGEGAHVVWSMDAKMGRNPFARVIGLMMPRMLGQSFDTGLQNLNATFAAI